VTWSKVLPRVHRAERRVGSLETLSDTAAGKHDFTGGPGQRVRPITKIAEASAFNRSPSFTMKNAPHHSTGLTRLRDVHARNR
jgi:hypothetical protein